MLTKLRKEEAEKTNPIRTLKIEIVDDNHNHTVSPCQQSRKVLFSAHPNSRHGDHEEQHDGERDNGDAGGGPQRQRSRRCAACSLIGTDWST
jgi:hypothetical protein